MGKKATNIPPKRVVKPAPPPKPCQNCQIKTSNLKLGNIDVCMDCEDRIIRASNYKYSLKLSEGIYSLRLSYKDMLQSGMEYLLTLVQRKREEVLENGNTPMIYPSEFWKWAETNGIDVFCSNKDEYFYELKQSTMLEF